MGGESTTYLKLGCTEGPTGSITLHEGGGIVGTSLSASVVLT